MHGQNKISQPKRSNFSNSACSTLEYYSNAVYARSKQNFLIQRKQLFKFSLFNFGILQYSEKDFCNQRETMIPAHCKRQWPSLIVVTQGMMYLLLPYYA